MPVSLTTTDVSYTTPRDTIKVFVSESDIEGLRIEAPTLQEFEAVMRDVAADLVFANHFTAADLVGTPLRDLMPAILWQGPDGDLAVA